MDGLMDRWIDAWMDEKYLLDFAYCYIEFPAVVHVQRCWLFPAYNPSVRN